MVLRSGAVSPTLKGELESGRREREELAREQGRGAPALRGNGEVIEVKSSSGRPVLSPKGVASALYFDQDGAAIVNDEGAPLDLAVRNLRVTGQITADGDIWAGSIRAGGNLSAAGVISKDGGYSIGITPQGDPVMWSPTDDVAWTAYNGDMYCTNPGNTQSRRVFGSAYPSERALKDHVGELENAVEVVDQWHPARFTWKPGGYYADDGREHAGVYVDELADSAPVLVEGTDARGNRMPDQRAMLAYLTAALQRRGREVDELVGQVAELRGQIEALTQAQQH